MRFVDTNILLYAISTAAEEEAKARTARALLKQPDLALSVQVLQEFYAQATRPSRSDRLTHEQAAGMVQAMLRFPVQDITVTIMQAALTGRKRYGISYWDAAIVEAARALNCGLVLSEDLNSGQDFGGVVVKNPFS